MSKKPIVFLVLALFVFSVFAIAQDTQDQTDEQQQDQNTEQQEDQNTQQVSFQDIALLEEQEELSSEEDMSEAEITHTSLGAKIRLLQLEKQVTKNYLYGEQVISQIKIKEYNVSTEDLQTTIDSLKDLDVEIKALLEKELSSDSVETYVELKHTAINLTKEFREFIRAQLTISQRQEIRDAIDKKEFAELEDINDDIRQAVREFNKERVLFMLEKLGINKTELLDKVESGNITAKELREEIKNAFKSLNKEEKKDFVKNIDEEKIKILTQRQKAFAKGLGFAKEHMEKAIELLNNRNFTYMEKRAKLGAMVKGEIVEKVKEYNNMHNITPKEIKNRINERIQELKDRRGEKE